MAFCSGEPSSAAPSRTERTCRVYKFIISVAIHVCYELISLETDVIFYTYLYCLILYTLSKFEGTLVKTYLCTFYTAFQPFFGSGMTFIVHSFTVSGIKILNKIRLHFRKHYHQNFVKIYVPTLFISRASSIMYVNLYIKSNILTLPSTPKHILLKVVYLNLKKTFEDVIAGTV